MNTTMNTVNQTFDWSRFTATLRKEVVENWRTILFTVVGVYALLAIVMILGNAIMGISGGETPTIDTDGNGIFPVHYIVVGYILAFAGTIVASLSFKKLTKKTGRIDMFTSPSSTFEKFLVNIVIYVLGFIVVFFICAQLADLTRIAILWYFHDRISVPGPINFLATFSQAYNFGEGSPASLTGMSNLFPIAILCSCGMFFMGSVLWPRLSFLKTFAAVYAVEIVIGILMLITMAIMGENGIIKLAQWLKDNVTETTIKILYATFMIGQLILFWGLSWFLFKRKDVISLKWWK